MALLDIFDIPRIFPYHEVSTSVVNFSQLRFVLELTNLFIDGVSCLFDFKASNCELLIVAMCLVCLLQQILYSVILARCSTFTGIINLRGTAYCNGEHVARA